MSSLPWSSQSHRGWGIVCTWMSFSERKADMLVMFFFLHNVMVEITMLDIVCQ